MRVDMLHRKLSRDISMLQPVMDTVFPVTLPEKYTSKPVSLKHFVAKLNSVSTEHQIFNEIQDDKEMEPGEFITSGLWLGDSELPSNESHADIRLIWHVHPDTKRIEWTVPRWNRRRFYWWQMLMHELIHRYQCIYRGEKETKQFVPQTTQRSLKESQFYLGDYDEIEAHAHNAALEFVTWFPGVTYRECVRKALTYSGRKLTPTYLEYSTAFVDTPRHPAMAVFKRKTKAWMDILLKNPQDYACLQLPGLVG